MGSAGGRDPIPRSAGGSASAEPHAAQQLARVMFALLTVACFAAFGVTQRLKHSPTAVQDFKMNPAFHPAARALSGCRGPLAKRQINTDKQLEYLSFKLARADEVSVEIVDSAGADVAGIVRDVPAERYKLVSLCWNGHRGPAQRGRVAPPGEYRLRVTLRHQNLTRYSTRSFVLEGPR